MKHPITHTHNGTAVYVDLILSPAAAHIAAQPHLLGLVKETLKQAKLTTPKVRLEQNMGRDVGYDYVVETSEKDTIFYAKLLRQETYTRFVKNGKSNATPYLSILMQKDDDGNYELYDTWVGRLTPPVPGSDDETSVSKTFWANHAHIFESQPLQLRSVTKVCPY